MDPSATSLALDSVTSSTEHGPVTFHQIHKLIHDIHDYSLMDLRKNLMLGYIFILLGYVGLNIGLLGVNFKPQHYIEEFYYLSFHLAEFWAVFIFTTMEAFILIFTGTVSTKNKLQSGLVLFNVIATLAIAIIFSIFPAAYEVPAHWMEYSVQIIITCVNFIFIINYVKNKDKTNFFYRFRYVEIALAAMVVVLSCLQILIYGGWVPVSIESERAAHFCEFTNEIFNACFALMYAILSYDELRQHIEDHYELMHKTV